MLAENLDDGLEREPLGDVLAASEHLAELGAGELLDGEALLLGDVGGDVAILVGVHDVEGGNGLHAELGGVRLGEVLGVVGAVEVLAVDGGLGPRHVAADDEVGAPVVLADDHVLDSLAGTGHVHGVREVRPPDGGVVHLLGEHLVGVVADEAGDVVVLGRAHGGVHQANRALAHVLGVESAGEELVVRPVDGVAALEGDDVLALGEHGANRRGIGAREGARGHGETLNLAADVELAALHGDHGDAGVLDGGGAVAHLGLQRLVGLPLGLDGDHGDVLTLVLEQHLVANLGVLAVGVEDDGHAEEEVAAGQAHLLDAVGVHVLVHEALERAEATDGEKLDVARVPVGELEGAVAGRDEASLLRVVRHEVHEGTAVGLDETGVRRGGGVEEGLAGGEGADEAGASLR